MSVSNRRAEAEVYATKLDADRRAALAEQLGLPTDALDALPLLGFRADDPQGPCYTFPEHDETGRVIGLNRRYPDGSKRMMPGGKRGLTLPTGWRERTGPLLVVEGPSDTLALTAAGLCAVGRPSNTGGVPLLAALLHDWPQDRDILVVGENDRKPDGSWPGRDGAEQTARQLAAKLNRPVRWTLPPEGAKDARAWLTHPDRGGTPWLQRGRALLAFLEAHAATIDPPNAGTPDDEPNDDPANPHRLATGFRAETPGPLRFWRGDFWRWSEGAYRLESDDDIRSELTSWIRRQFVAINQRELAAWREAGGDGLPPTTRAASNRLVGDVLNALRGECLLPSNTEPPAWIDGAIGPDPANLLPLRNGVLDIPTGRLMPASPDLFAVNACPFDFDPHAPEPKHWLRFLETLWPDDPDSVAALQEWFGYLLTADTRQQKILFLLGPKRSGKGTICRVLTALVGPANVAGPTLGSLATNFGLSPLLGKTVAIVSDARLGNRADAVAITERLLSISGEDSLTIDRKHRDPITVKLPTRFVIASNELPKLGDASGALAGRLVLLRFTRSFFGSEDHGLTDRLLRELPGILNWSLDGWRRLRARGRFVQPPSGAELLAELEDLTSPVGAFIRDRCRVEPGASVEVGELYAAWRSWCEEHGRKEPGTEQAFGRDLRAAVPTLGVRQPKRDGKRWREYVGIRLRGMDEPDEPELGTRGHAGNAVLPMHAVRTQNGESTEARGNTVGAAIEGIAFPACPRVPGQLFPDMPGLPD